MRQKFKKISAIAASVLMVGMSIGGAFAASTATTSFPNSFTGSDVAIVYGASAASSDQTASNTINTYLTPKMSTSSTSTSVSGGEVFTIEKTSDKFNVGDKLNFVGTLTGDDMTFLADGTYKDGKVDEDYSQEIKLSDNTLGLFTNDKYKDGEPTMGFTWAKGDNVLNYTIEFNDEVAFTDMNTTEVPLLGGKYYVVDSAKGIIDLLDSANTQTANQGETVTVSGKSVVVKFIDDDKSVTFSVDGKDTGSLSAGDSYKLSDGSYISVSAVRTSSKESITNQVDFSIGSGKITLEDGEEVKLNSNRVKGLYAYLDDSTTGVTSITLAWNAADDLFLTKDSSLTMPLFGKVTLAFDGLSFPSDPEKISLDSGQTLTLNMGNYDLPVAWYNSTANATIVGDKSHPLITSIKNVTYGDDWNNGTANITVKYPNVLAIKDGERFLVTDINPDSLTDTKTLYYEVNTLDPTNAGTSSDPQLSLDDLIGSSDFSLEKATSDKKLSGITVTLMGFSADSKTAYLSFSGATDYNKAVSEKGMIITLDSSKIDDTTSNATGVSAITFTEADKDGNLEGGEKTFSVNLKVSTNDKLYAVSTTDVTMEEETTKDQYIGYVASDLASKVTADESKDEYTYNVEYYGEEVPATVKLVAGGEVSSSTSGAQVVVLKDTEVSATESRNLIVVGGSCINTVAQKLLGGTSPICGSAFTAKTNVGAGQFLIENFNSPYSNGKYALLVAGYDAADTTKAATYLTTSASSLDLTAGNPNVVSSATVVTTTSQ